MKIIFFFKTWIRNTDKYYQNRLPTSAMLPELDLGDGDKLALLALERLHLALRVDPRDANLAMT